MAETERSPYRNGVSGRSGPPKDENEAASPAAQHSGLKGDMTDVPPPSTASKPASQIPKLAASSIPTPTVSASPSTTNSAVSSREPSPIRPPSLRAGASNSPSRFPSLSRNNSQDRSPHRSNPAGYSSNSSVTTVQQQHASTTSTSSSSSQSGNPLVFNPPEVLESSVNDSDQDKSNMAAWAASRRAEHESYLANTSSKRASVADDDSAKGDRSAPRAVNNNNNNNNNNRGLASGPGAPLETVQETTSDQSTPSADTILNNPTFEESRLQNIGEDTTPKALKQASVGTVESGSDSGGNKSSDPKEDDQRRRTSSGDARKDAIIPKRSTTSLSGARGKPADGSARNMIVETETVSSIPQVSLSAATGDRGHSGRADHQGPLRLKPSTETIRPKKEKKRLRKPAPLPNGAASSKADIFEAKVASAVDEADVSDSDETFVYESNPPDPYPVRSRYHSRTPSATSMASQADQFAARARPPMRDNNHSVSGKRSMKFTNNTYNSSVDGDVPDEGRSGPGRHDGASSHTPRHHHVGRNGRTNTYTSLFDSDSPFPQAQSYIKSPRHFIGSGFRQSKHPGSRGPVNYRTINKKNGDAFSYDFDAEGADDERTPLVGSPRVPRSRHGGRRPNSASLRQMEYMQRRQGCISRYGVCVVISILLSLVIVLGTTFIVAVTKPLQNVKVAAIQNVLASEQELMLDLNVLAVNPNLFPVTVDNMDINIFAKSRYVGTDSLWREYGAALYDTPRVDRSKKRAELAHRSKNELVERASGGVDHGTDPIPSDPVGDPQTMLLGRVFSFDSSLAFEPSPWKHVASSSKGQIRLQRPGNKTEEGGTERWERVLQHPFDLIVRGVIKYQLPMSSRYVSSSVSSSVKVTPDKDDNGDGHTHDPKPPNNDTVVMSVPSALLRRRLLLEKQLLSEQGALNNITQRTFTA